MENAAAKARTGRSASVLSTIWRGVVHLSHCNRLRHRHKRVTATVQQEMSSTRKPRPLPPEIQRRPPRDHASTAPRALEFALPGQW
jgi:hypothetical protein